MSTPESFRSVDEDDDKYRPGQCLDCGDWDSHLVDGVVCRACESRAKSSSSE